MMQVVNFAHDKFIQYELYSQMAPLPGILLYYSLITGSGWAVISRWYQRSIMAELSFLGQSEQMGPNSIYCGLSIESSG